MKRSWIGAGLLLALLALGILTSLGMQRVHDPIAQDLQRAAVLAAEENWPEAMHYVNLAQLAWQEAWGFSASLADHEPMEEINGLFAQLEVCGGLRDPETYALLCAQLREELEAMGEAHRFAWWNLL